MQHYPRTVILGTDWWTDCDDVAAVRIACRLARQGIWTLAGVILNACMPASAASLDGFLRAEGLDVPIGIDLEATDFGRKPPYQQPLAQRTGSTLANSDCENALHLYRRLLADAPDGSIELLELGYPQVLAALLASPPDALSPLDGRSLVAAKVRTLWIMGGNWKHDADGRENNFSRNRRAALGAQALLHNYPGEIRLLGFEVGVSVITHPPADPDDLLHAAYLAHGSLAGRSSWDPMLVLMAARCPDANDTQLADAGYRTVRGTASVDAEGHNTFRRAHDGRHRYVQKLHDDAWYADQIDTIIQQKSRS